MDECSRVEFSARVLQGCKQSVAPRRGHGLDAARTKAMISVWKSRGYIFQISDFSYKKSEE